MRVWSGAGVCELLSRHGFTEVKRRGSHIVMQKQINGNTVTVPVPAHRELRPGSDGHHSPVWACAVIVRGRWSRALSRLVGWPWQAGRTSELLQQPHASSTSTATSAISRKWALKVSTVAPAWMAVAAIQSRTASRVLRIEAQPVHRHIASSTSPSGATACSNCLYSASLQVPANWRRPLDGTA